MDYKLGCLSVDVICSEKRTVFRERTCTWGKLWQIISQNKYPRKLLQKISILCSLSFKCFSRLVRIGEYYRIFPCFKWGVFGQVPLLDHYWIDYNSWYIFLPSSAKQHLEMIKFWVVCGTWTTTAFFLDSYFTEVFTVLQIQFRESFTVRNKLNHFTLLQDS